MLLLSVVTFLCAAVAIVGKYKATLFNRVTNPSRRPERGTLMTIETMYHNYCAIESCLSARKQSKLSVFRVGGRAQVCKMSTPGSYRDSASMLSTPRGQSMAEDEDEKRECTPMRGMLGGAGPEIGVVTLPWLFQCSTCGQQKQTR